MKKLMIISYINDQEDIEIPDELANLLKDAFEEVARLHNLTSNVEVDINIIDDKQIHELNRMYRNVDRPTDVLSFALDEDAGEPKLLDEQGVHLLGDILISAQTAKKQADEFGHGLTREIIYLAVHGFLHLLGYDHMVDADKKIMRAKEEEILREINLSEEFFTREK